VELVEVGGATDEIRVLGERDEERRQTRQRTFLSLRRV